MTASRFAETTESASTTTIRVVLGVGISELFQQPLEGIPFAPKASIMTLVRHCAGCGCRQRCVICAVVGDHVDVVERTGIVERSKALEETRQLSLLIVGRDE